MLKILVLGYLLSGALPATETHTELVNRMLTNEIQWIVKNSDLEYNGETLPKIEYATLEEVNTMMYGVEAVQSAKATGKSIRDVIAIYNHTRNVIVLNDQTEIMDWEHRYIIVHELVHFLQFVNDVDETVPCLRGLEAQAYELHMKWMDEFNAPGFRPNPITMLFIKNACDPKF